MWCAYESTVWKRSIILVISVPATKTLGHFSISRRKDITPPYIYIIYDICQTFINYKLMKCTTAPRDCINAHVEFLKKCIFDTSLLSLMSFILSRPINRYYVTGRQMTVTCHSNNVTLSRWTSRERQRRLRRHKLFYAAVCSCWQCMALWTIFWRKLRNSNLSKVFFLLLFFL